MLRSCSVVSLNCCRSFCLMVSDVGLWMSLCICFICL